MTVTLDHVILPTTDQAAAAAFLSKMLGLPPGVPVGHFVCIPLGNGVTVDVMASDHYQSVHLAFLVDDDTFDRAVAVLRSERLPHSCGQEVARAGGLPETMRARDRSDGSCQIGRPSAPVTRRSQAGTDRAGR
jgi:catechol 2,3-dioxygenase-like lactoylglutathione lyase family enzyme